MARRLNIRSADLRAAVQAGQIPCIRVGEAILFKPHETEVAILRLGPRAVRNDR